jgi:hypothetical protein
VDTELATLANAGATALIGLMASDSWPQVKGRFAHLYARSSAMASTLRRMETSQAELMGDELRNLLNPHASARAVYNVNGRRSAHVTWHLMQDQRCQRS